MNKEKLTLDNIKQDLAIAVRDQSSVIEEKYSSYITLLTAIALILMFVFQLVWLGIAVFAVNAVLLVLYIIASAPHKKQKKAIKACFERGDIAISVETLSHIVTETVQEPHPGRRGRTHLYKDIIVFYFASGASWRVPKVKKHYKWSKEYFLSTEGLDNISVPGNEFYLVSLQGHYDIAYIYPCKLFELDGSLQKKA